MDTQQTRVVFRRYKAKNYAHEILALFPDESSRPGICMSYQHTGQHSEADYAGCIRDTVPATPKEYAPLKRELEQIGYRVKIAKRR